MKTAAFIGRFQPFHKGHLSAVREILGENDQLKIVLGSFKKNHTQNNPLNGDERYSIIKNVLESEGFGGRFEIFSMPDYSNDNRWVDELFKLTGDLDVVYTANEHTKRCLVSRVKVRMQNMYEPETYNATSVRELIRKGRDWEDRVPDSVAKELREKGLVDVIKTSGSPPDKVKDVAEFLSRVKNCKVAIIHHDDCDGVCSGVLAGKIVERGEGNKISMFTTRFAPKVTDDLYKDVAALKPELIIMSDFVEDTDKSSERFIKELGCKVVIVDHHVCRDYKFVDGVLYTNPRVDINPDRYIPASAYMYMIGCEADENFKKYLWIATVGTIADYGAADNEELIRKCIDKYDDLFDCNSIENRDLFKTKFGSISNSIGAVISWDGWSGVDMVTKVLSSVKDPYEFLAAGTPELKKVWNEYRKIEAEIKKVVEDFNVKRKKDGKILMYEVVSKYPLKSKISTIISSQVDDENVVIIWQKENDKIRASLRNQSGDVDLNKVVCESIKGLDARGGGHPKASGVIVSKKDFDKMLERIVRMVNCK